MFLLIGLLCAGIASATLVASEAKSTEFKALPYSILSDGSNAEKMIERFAPPKKIQTDILNGKHVLSIDSKDFLDVISDVQLPFYIEKPHGIDRVVNAERLRTCIKQNELDLEVPHKYIFEKKGLWQVFAEGLSLEGIQKNTTKDNLTLKEVQDLTILAEKTCYYDFHFWNILRNKQTGKLAIIDTEDTGFKQNKTKSECAQFVGRRHRGNSFEDHMTPEAKDWYHTHLQNLANEGDTTLKPLSQFDDGTINFKEAMSELNSINAHSLIDKYNRVLEKFDRTCMQPNLEKSMRTPCHYKFQKLRSLNRILDSKYGVSRDELVRKYWF